MEKLKPLKIIHVFLSISCLTIIAVNSYVNEINFQWPIKTFNSEIAIILGVSFVAILASKVYVTLELKKIRPEMDFKTKMGMYQKAKIVEMAIVEGAVMFVYFLFPTYGVLALIPFMYLLSIHPWEFKAKSYLE